MLLQSVLSALCFCLGIALAKSHPTVYMIRHGEKPQDPNDYGLTPDGVKRAQCLRHVFGQGSEYNIRHIMAPRVKKGKVTRSLESKPIPQCRNEARGRLSFIDIADNMLSVCRWQAWPCVWNRSTACQRSRSHSWHSLQAEPSEMRG